MPKFGKIHDAIYMIIHRKKFRKVSIDVLRESQRFEQVLQYEKENLEANFKKLQEKHNSTVDLTAKLIDENRALKKKIEEYESGQERWEILDL
jgi:hypothetical protein